MNEAISIVLPRIGLVKLTENQFINFWKKVWIAGDTECWEWLGARDWDGYGRWHPDSKTSPFMAHALSYAMSGGSFDDGTIVRHFVCRNAGCVNPKHLRAGTYQDNSNDMKRDGTQCKGDRHHFRRNPERVQGENHPRSKLTASDVVEIRRLFETEGSTRKELSARFGVTPAHIGDIVMRVKGGWSHIP